MKKNYDIVDLFKWICAWLVVCIHIPPFQSDVALLNVFIVQGIARIAVPFFFSTSMFFLFKKLKRDEDKKINRKSILRFAIRIFSLYIGWALIYYAYRAFYRVYNGINYPYTPFGIILDFFARGVHYHLWYLIATVIALPAVCLLWRCGRVPLIVTCVFLHILQCLDLPYHFAPIFDHPVIAFYTEEYDILSRTILHAIPLMCLGVICQMDASKRSGKEWGKLLLIALVVFFAELIILLVIKGKELKMERSLTSVFLVYCLTNWLFTMEFQFTKAWIGKALRISSVWIYCIHPLVRELYHWVFAYDGIIRFVVVCAVTFVSSVMYTALKLWWEKRCALRKQRKLQVPS